MAGSKTTGRKEFILLCATLTSLVALSIDAMLPALPAISHDLTVPHANDAQLVVSILFLGFGFGQLIAGGLSDSIGRKKAIYTGLGIFLAGSTLCVFSQNFETMLAGRFLQGIGLAGPRTVSMAMVRDLFSGRDMARVMSFIMAVFIIVPALAPAIGQYILNLSHWRWIFASLATMGLLALFWLALRQQETLHPDKRLAFSLKQLMSGVRETLYTRTSLGYTITAGLIFGAFVGYLGSSQQIFQNVYDLGDDFPLFFGILALAIGLASFVNGQLVHRFGMRRLLKIALISKIMFALAFLALINISINFQALPYFTIWGVLTFFCIGILFGNLGALALEPLGHIAGMAASIFGAISTIISVMLGAIIGQNFDGSIFPLIIGFAILGILGYFVIYWTEKEIS